MSGFGPACAAPACDLFAPAAPSNSFNEFLQSADRAGRFLVEVTLYPKSAAPLNIPSFPACGAPACSIADPEGELDPPIELRLSDHPVLLEPDDTLRPNYATEARLARRVDIDTAFSIIPNTSAAGQVLAGDVEVFNADGWLDQYVTDYSVDGRRVRVLFGPENGAYSENRVLEETFGKDWRGDDEETRLTLQDLQFRLDQPYQSAEYAGTGGIEGDASLTGRLKPRLIGHRYNFTPVRISSANNIYDLGAPFHELVKVRDGGAELTDSAIDVSTYASLASLTIAEGEFATAKNLGLFRIQPAGGSLSSILTIEARGDTTSGYTEAAGDIIVRELRNRAGFVDTEIDAGSFATLNSYATGDWYDGENEETFATIIGRLTTQGHARLIADSRIRAIRIVDPASATFNFEIGENQIFDLAPEGEIYPPIVKTIVKYRPNDAVLSEAQLVGTPPDADDLQRDYQQTFYRDSSTLLRHASATPEITIETNLYDEDSAVALAASVGSVWRSARMIYRIEANREALFFKVGSVVKITHPRFGFDAGANGLIVQRLNDYNEQKAELRVLV
ncbi:MAG: hypothetical protein AAGC77_06480 [Pseudomonadota bacterium]